MVVFAAGCEHAEVGEDVVLGVAADPGSVLPRQQFPSQRVPIGMYTVCH